MLPRQLRVHTHIHTHTPLRYFAHQLLPHPNLTQLPPVCCTQQCRPTTGPPPQQRRRCGQCQSRQKSSARTLACVGHACSGPALEGFEERECEWVFHVCVCVCVGRTCLGPALEGFEEWERGWRCALREGGCMLCVWYVCVCVIGVLINPCSGECGLKHGFDCVCVSVCVRVCVHVCVCVCVSMCVYVCVL
jgi:hypothetical protein